MTTRQTSSGKHIPQRTCIACRESKPKRELVRIVSTPDGKAEVDNTGKKSGRGAYLCRTPLCWSKGLNKGRLEKALRMKISDEDVIKLSGISDIL